MKCADDAAAAGRIWMQFRVAKATHGGFERDTFWPDQGPERGHSAESTSINPSVLSRLFAIVQLFGMATPPPRLASPPPPPPAGAAPEGGGSTTFGAIQEH